MFNYAIKEQIPFHDFSLSNKTYCILEFQLGDSVSIPEEHAVAIGGLAIGRTFAGASWDYRGKNVFAKVFKNKVSVFLNKGRSSEVRLSQVLNSISSLITEYIVQAGLVTRPLDTEHGSHSPIVENSLVLETEHFENVCCYIGAEELKCEYDRVRQLYMADFKTLPYKMNLREMRAALENHGVDIKGDVFQKRGVFVFRMGRIHMDENRPSYRMLHTPPASMITNLYDWLFGDAAEYRTSEKPVYFNFVPEEEYAEV